MKRGAERQITKDGPDDDDDDDDDIEEIQDPRFRKADESALAKRQIRALPKRALAASKPPSFNGMPPALAADADNVATSLPKFGGFSGFGAGPSVPSPFTFIAQPPPVSASASPALDTAFKPTQPSSTLNSTLLSPFLGAPKLSPSDSDVSPPKSTTSPPTEGMDAVAFKYFKSLRGLNISFLSAISTAVEKDPFFDVAGLVESYKNLRTTIQSEFDSFSQPVAVRSSVVTNSTPPFGAKASSEKTISLFSMPKPPVGSAEALSKPSLTSESGTKAGGFTFASFLPSPSSAPTQLPFGLASKSSEPSASSSITLPEPPKSTFAFALPNTSASMSSLPSTSGLSFAAPKNTENTTSKSDPDSPSQETEGSSAGSSSQPALTATSFDSRSVPNFFATTKPTSVFGTFDVAAKSTSVFGSSIFGSSNTTESSKPPTPNPTPFEGKDDSKITTALFGNATTPSTSTSIFRSSSDKPVGFFGSASPPKTSAFAFGKPGGSIGNPVGFGFGSSAPSTGDATVSGSSGSGFNFGVPSTNSSERLFSPPTTDKSTESTPQPEAEGNEESADGDAAKLLPSHTHTHDEEGEGEEDEETTHAVRCKVYRLSRSEDKSEWKDLGVGMFRLKKHKETNVRRVLMRNSNTGRILVNFRIYGNLKLSLAKTSVSFIGYENSTPTSFRLRVKTEEQAGDLKQAMERDIAAVQVAE